PSVVWDIHGKFANPRIIPAPPDEFSIVLTTHMFIYLSIGHLIRFFTLSLASFVKGVSILFMPFVQFPSVSIRANRNSIFKFAPRSLKGALIVFLVFAKSAFDKLKSSFNI